MMSKLTLFVVSLLLSASVDVVAQDVYEQCEDTCTHIHGIDLSHYQGEVFWGAYRCQRQDGIRLS